MLSVNNLKPTGRKLSTYSQKLKREHPDVFRRYIEKIRIINFNDPYAENQLMASNLPTNITTGHVVDYLVNFRSPYTGQPVKNSRSLEGYKKFEGGFVHSVVAKSSDSNFVVIGKVVHSMRLREAMLKAWIIIDQRGSILSAHCDCVAGCSETCSHVSAVLYSLANLHAQSTDRRITVTDIPAYWRQPPKNIRDDLYKQINDISYGKVTQRFYDTPVARSKQDFLNLIKQIDSDGIDATVIRAECDGNNFTCKECQSGTVPDRMLCSKSILLQGNFNIENEKKSLELLREMGKTINLRITNEDVTWVEAFTRRQRETDFWHWVRIGRITASILKSVVHTSNEVPPPKATLIRKICYPSDLQFDCPATTYGRRNEPLARSHIAAYWSKYHEEATVEECGLFISQEYPFLAASPDAIGKCACCGSFSIEIKCPFRLRNQSLLDQQLSIKDIAEKRHSFIKLNNGTIEINEEHEYYYQVQAQIFLTNSDFGLFVVWSKQENTVIKVEKNFDLWNYCILRSSLYFYKIIMPELLGNYYSNKIKK